MSHSHTPSETRKQSAGRIGRLAYPLILGQLGHVVVMVADNVMVGRLGKTELAGISFAIAVAAIYWVVGIGVSMALPPLISEAHGRKNDRELSQALFTSLWLNLIFSVLVVIGVYACMPLYLMLGVKEEVVRISIPYIEISAWGMIPFMIFQAARALVDGRGDTRISMYALLLGNLANIVLNYLLIYGKGGFPALGVAGAAWASFLARLVMLVVLFAYIFGRSEYRHFIVDQR